jgi:hypothetical protein
LKGKIMSGNPVFRGTRVPVHMLAELVPSRACARTRYRRGSVTLFFDCFSKRAQQPIEPTRQTSLVPAFVGESPQPPIAPGSGSFWVIGTRHHGPEQGPWQRR